MQAELTAGLAAERIGATERSTRPTARRDVALELYPRSIMASLLAAWHGSRSLRDLDDLATHREAGRETGARF